MEQQENIAVTKDVELPDGSKLGVERLVRPLRGRRAATIRSRFCKRQADTLWGQRRFVTPVFVPFQWGDGKQLIGLRPIAIRREWYVLPIDSRMEIGRPNGGFDEDDAFREMLDESIYPTLEGHFGLFSDYDIEDELAAVQSAREAWPSVNHECGHEWFWLGDL